MLWAYFCRNMAPTHKWDCTVRVLRRLCMHAYALCGLVMRRMSNACDWYLYVSIACRILMSTVFKFSDDTYATAAIAHV